MPAAPSSAVAELRASAHIMTLEPGLFCVFHAPGTAPPDAATGLPGVRLSRSPAGVAGGRVEISTFADDGWLGTDGAALIRVSGGPGRVLVTIYQAQEGGGPAPNLRVTCLTPPPEPTPPQLDPRLNPGPAPLPPEVEAHVYGRGDVGGQLGDWMGDPGSERWIEGFALQPRGTVAADEIEYQAVLGRGWLSPWTTGGQFCGSRGMALPILGLAVRLRGGAAERFDAVVSATFVDGATAGPAAAGEACEAASLAPLEAFRVELRPCAPVRKRPRTPRAPR